MRKCPACGYLLLGDGEACKHCGAALPELVGAGIGAGPAPSPALAPSPPPPPPPLAPPSAFPPVPPALSPGAPAPSGGRQAVGREYWSPPEVSAARVAPRRTTSPRILLALVCVASMAFGWIGFNRVFESDPLPSGTGEFVHGHGVAYSSPDHTFDAQFPVAPRVERRVLTVSAASATLDLAQVQTDDYEVVAASLVLPAAVPADRVSAVLHDILYAGAIAQGDKILTEKQITKFGVPGIEVRASVDDGYDARLIVLMSGTHLYLLGVHSKHATKRLYDALVSSLVMY